MGIFSDLTYSTPRSSRRSARPLEVRDDGIHVAKGTDGGVGESVTDLDRAAGARRSELHDAERIVRRIVDVELEADLIDIEPQRSLDSLTGSMITSIENMGVHTVRSPFQENDLGQFQAVANFRFCHWGVLDFCRGLNGSPQ
jgi:hypothetical protein